jgi:hypothetical protein
MRATSHAWPRLWIPILFVAFAGSLSAQGVNLFPAPGAEGTGESELKALATAYPDRISSVELHDGDWAVNLDGEWFSWAHGRILPETQSGDWEKYARFRFYPYPLGGLPPLRTLDADTASRLRKLLEDSRAHPPRRSEAFLERLFKVGSHAETVRRIVSVDFLGFHVQVNQRIAAALRDVAAECESARRSDPQCAAFLAGLAEIDGFNYRDVAGTLSRSYHGYGLAVDLIPRSYGGKAAYWRWVMDGNGEKNAAAGAADWWATPYERRWAVPMPIVSAFERHGFVWGGKWLFFDTMHFEYRPEIFILARQPAAATSLSDPKRAWRPARHGA